MELTLDATGTFEDLWLDLEAGYRYSWHEGGSRSGKTYNIAAALLLYCRQEAVTCDVVRLSNPALKGSVYLDLLEVGQTLALYGEALHNKTDQYFDLPANEHGKKGRIRYFGVDQEQKVRGWKRDILWMNEANEISDAARRQLWMRTTQAIVIDHNPVIDGEHWIVSRLELRREKGDCSYHHTTYRDNPFLEDAIVREIEAMQLDDPFGWQVYGQGLRGSNPAAVFTDVSRGTFESQKETIYAVDFGFKDPFVVCEWGWKDADPPVRPKPTLFCRPLIYATHITTGEALDRLDDMGADKKKRMNCDSAEPDRIREIRQRGYNAHPVEKRQNARKAGYAWMKAHRLVVDREAEASEAVRLELKRTRHKKKPGLDKYTDDVVDDDDHVVDTGRYGAFEAWGPKRKAGAGAMAAMRKTPTSTSSPLAAIR